MIWPIEITYGQKVSASPAHPCRHRQTCVPLALSDVHAFYINLALMPMCVRTERRNWTSLSHTPSVGSCLAVILFVWTALVVAIGFCCRNNHTARR